MFFLHHYYIQFIKQNIDIWNNNKILLSLKINPFKMYKSLEGWYTIILYLVCIKCVYLHVCIWKYLYVCIYACMYVCMYVCTHLCTLSGTNIWLYTDLAAPREWSVPILVPIILNLPFREKWKIVHPKIIVFWCQ